MAADLSKTSLDRSRHNPSRIGTSNKIRYRGLLDSGRRILATEYVTSSSSASDMVECGSLRNSEMDRETYQLHETLRELYGTPGLLLSLSELKGKERKESRFSISWIPCNYVMLTCCPGKTLEEQIANIFRHCAEYREAGIYEPNQIIQIGSKLLVEWTYSSVLPGKALARWQPVQEHLRGHFKDWGAIGEPRIPESDGIIASAGICVRKRRDSRPVYSELEKRYTLNGLANAIEDIEQLKRVVQAIPVDVHRKHGDFRAIAQMRFVDILHWLERQKVRELSVFWALVCAKQAGLITTWEEFCIKAQKLIDFCGTQFESECTIETVKTAFTKDYPVKTATLIHKLQITPEAQKEMKVLYEGKRLTTRRRSLQNREEYLETHDQERRQPWLAYKFSRRIYFRCKAAGTLPPLPVQIEANVPPIPEKNRWHRCATYMMRAALLSWISSEVVSVSGCS